MKVSDADFESVMLSNHLILCHPLLLPPSIFPTIMVFSNESGLCIRWPKYWSSTSFSISPSNEYSGLISFRIDCFDLLAVQGTLKSLLQHHSFKASILHCLLITQLPKAKFLMVSDFRGQDVSVSKKAGVLRPLCCCNLSLGEISLSCSAL